jgi:hypothetical protein
VKSGDASDAPTPPAYPYKGLLPYDTDDRGIFAARDGDIRTCAEAFSRSPARLLVLHGTSGCGKSSFLRAGLIPFIEEWSHGLRFARSPREGVLFIRSTGEPLVALAHEFETIATHLSLAAKRNKTPIAHQHFRKFVALSADAAVWAGNHSSKVFDALSALALAVPWTFLIIIDQAEEIFTQQSTQSDQSHHRYFELLARLASSDLNIKVLLSMRTEFKGQFDDQLGARRVLPTTLAGYYLDEMDVNQLSAAITHPTTLRSASGGRLFEFSYEPGLPERIATDLVEARPSGGLLPTLQVVCSRLVRYVHASMSTRAGAVIRSADYLAMGGVHRQIESHIEDAVISSTSGEDSRRGAVADAWRLVLHTLADVQPDGRVASREVAERSLQEVAHAVGLPVSSAQLEQLGEWPWQLIRHGGRDRPRARTWTLTHDCVGLALARWKTVFDSLRLERTFQAPSDLLVPRPAHIDIGDAPSLNLTTFNDLVWDHLLLRYAAERPVTGAARVSLNVPEPFDAAMNENFRYRSFFTSGDAGRVAVLPRDIISAQRFDDLMVMNVFIGHALIGPRLKGVPVLAEYLHESIRVRQRLLKQLRAALRRLGIGIWTYKEANANSERFVATILPDSAPLIRSLGTSETSFYRRRRDIAYQKLTSGGDRFVVGSAMTRALAEQAGYVTYLDALAARQYFSDFPDGPERLATLQSMLMHNTLQISRDADSTTQMRVACLGFAAVERARRYPDSFVEYIHSVVRDESPDFPVDRTHIREAIAASYHLVDFEGYAAAYLMPLSPLTTLGAFGKGRPRWAHRRWKQLITTFEKVRALRSRCEAMQTEVAARVATARPGTDAAHRLFDLQAKAEAYRRAWNFVDAASALTACLEIVA